MLQNLSRRSFLKIFAAIGVLLASKKIWDFWLGPKEKPAFIGPYLGINQDGYSQVYLAQNGSPEENIEKIVEMMGGIDHIIDPEDIVILKPNAQWWNQGMTNTDVMKRFIDLVLQIPDYRGEIIVAENHQHSTDNSRGWTTDKRNGQFNLNELVNYFQEKGYKNVTKYHWHVAGTCKEPLEGDAEGNKRVRGPEDGDGYVWMVDNYYVSPLGRKCLMTYPVFTSSYSGITIDLKNGAWQNGKYIDRNVKFINFSALNHHSRYGGVTASVKNLMGVVDMTCGWPGDSFQSTYNVHHIGYSRLIRLYKACVDVLVNWHWRFEILLSPFFSYCTRNFHHTGGALGHFMKHVRMPDLNIITAIRVGWGSRINYDMAFSPDTVLASADPVALDYIAAKEILLPGTPPDQIETFSGITYRELNDPDQLDKPFRKFIQEAHKQGIGNLEKNRIKIIKHTGNNSPETAQG